MDTTPFNWSSYASPSRRSYGVMNDGVWLSTKAEETSGARRNSFSIDAILSRKAPDHVQQSMRTQHGPTYPPPALPIWPPAGCSVTNSPYPLYYMGYRHQNVNGSALYTNDYTASCEKLISKRNYVRRTCRRIRTIFTDEQLKRLEEVFSKQRYMTGTEKVLLASALHLSETQVKVWFQNRRTRWRKTQEDDKSASSPETNDASQGTSNGEEDSWSS